MRYAKYENDKWIEVQGNAVPHETLLKMGFVDLKKIDRQISENEEIVIKLIDAKCEEVVLSHTYKAIFGTDGLNIRTLNKAQLSFLQSFYKERETITIDGTNVTHSWQFDLDDKGPIRRLCWNKFRDVCDDFIDSHSSGVSRRDMAMKTIFPDFPLSNDNGAIINDTTWASIKLEINTALSSKNTTIRTKVLPKGPDTISEFSEKFPEICRWIGKGLLPE